MASHNNILGFYFVALPAKL